MVEKQKLEKLVRNTFIDFMQGADFVENPVVFNRAEGPYVWDVDGKRYFDAIGGIFVASLGHRHPRLVERMKRQIDVMTFSPPMHGISDVSLRFVERLGEVTPGNLNYIKSFSGGSESIEAALKLTRQYYKTTGRPEKMKSIGVYLSYHGATFATLSAGGGTRKSMFEPLMPGFLMAPSPAQLRDSFPTWDEACRFAAEYVETIVISESPETIGSVVVEPICNTGGIVTPTDEYLKILRSICDRYDIMLIFDEVLTGYGKTGDLFAAQTFGTTPDIICSGKGMCSGMIPSGAIMAREDIGSVFYGGDTVFMHGHTYAAFPLANAVATEVIDIMEEQNLPARADVIGRRIRGHLAELTKLGIVREVRGKGCLLGVELVKDSVTNEPFPHSKKLGAALKKTAMENGVILRIDPDWFAVAPPLICTDGEIDEMCGLIVKSVKDALDALC